MQVKDQGSGSGAHRQSEELWPQQTDNVLQIADNVSIPCRSCFTIVGSAVTWAVTLGRGMAAVSGYVFVSYSHKDKAVVDALVQALENRGISFRFDRDLAVGEAVQERLRQLLNDAGAVLVVWSPHSASSAPVIDEAGRARERERLVPVGLTGTADVPHSFQDLQILDLSGWAGDPSDPRLNQLGRVLQDRLVSQPGATSRSKPWYRRMPAWVGPAIVGPLIVGVILAFVNGWAGRITGGSPSPSAAPSGTITEPPNGASNVAAHKNLQVSGTAQGIPSGDRLDLLLQFVDSGNGIRYYIAADPNTAIKLDNGHWSAPIFIGATGSIIIRLVMLSPSEIAYVNSRPSYQNNGFPAIPGTVLASATYKAQ